MSDQRSEDGSDMQSLYAQQVVSANRSTVMHSRENACCVCGSRKFTQSMQLVATRFDIHDCQQCGTGVLSPLPSSGELASFYIGQYYGESGQKFGRLTEIPVRLIGNRQTRFLTRHLSAGGRVLDVGCGRGVVASPLAAAGYSVTGVEISRDAVGGIDPRVEVVVAGSLEEAPLATESFDLVVIWHVLEHVVDPAATLQAAHRVLKPGGKLVVAVPNYSSWQSRLFGSAWFHLDPPRHLYHFSAAGLRMLLEKCGFEVQQSHHFSLRQNPFGWVQSGLNWIMPKRRNQLYSYLLNEPSAAQGHSHVAKLFWFVAYMTGMIAVLPLTVIASLCRSGGTIHYLAVRQACVTEETNRGH